MAESAGNDYAGVVRGVTLSVSVVYTIEIQAVDKLGESGSVETRIPTSEMTFHLGENGKAVGIGRYASESGEARLDVAWDAHFEKGLQVSGAADFGETPPNVAVLDNAGFMYYRTPEELRADLGYGDYIVSQGTSGIWTYRKWASGVAECWANKNCGDIAVTSAWGALYESANIGSIAYPEGLFVAQPIFSSSVSKTTKYSASGIETDGGSASATPSLYLLRATAGTIQGAEISLAAKGRWKQ